MLFNFSIRWSVYCGLSFLTLLATIFPLARVGVGILIFCFFLYLIFNTAQKFADIEANGSTQGKQALIWAISENGMEFIALIIAVVAGIYIGIN